MIRGVFKDFQGVVLEVKANDNIVVGLDVFGRQISVTLHLDDLDIDLMSPINRFIKLIEKDIISTLEAQLEQWWVEKLPFEQNNLVAEWEAFIEYQEQLTVVTNQKKEALLNQFTTEFAAIDELGYNWAKQKWQAEEERWTPFTYLYEQERRQRLENRNKYSTTPYPPNLELILQGRERSWEAQNQAWRQKNLPSEETAVAIRQQATKEAQLLVEEMRAYFQQTHGLTLPDHVFTFWAFWLSLNDTLKEVMDYIEVDPVGIFDIFSDFQKSSVELNDRYYNDPPEFITVFSGRSDGLHYGLWYDDPKNEPIGVMSYYGCEADEISNNGAKTVLEEVRYQIEESQSYIDLPCTDGLGYLSEEEYRIKKIELSALRDNVMAFETGERLETGKNYLETYTENLTCERIPTVDGVGVFIADCFLERDINSISSTILNDDAIVNTWIESALQKCAENQPAEALALGRDLHWLSNKNPIREAAAAKLLEAAYKVLNRNALVLIITKHYQYRKSLAAYNFD